MKLKRRHVPWIILAVLLIFLLLVAVGVLKPSP